VHKMFTGLAVATALAEVANAQQVCDRVLTMGQQAV
jgi:hypothetical protein